MGFDDLKEHNGQKYMGMSVGGKHTWNYPDGLWKEEKVNPDTWVFEFSSVKRRRRAAPKNSGAPINTQYHWYIIADQRVRKLDKDTYETMMEGIKRKIAHKRPHWRRWSSQYEGNTSDREKIIETLEYVLKGLKNSHGFEYQNAGMAYIKHWNDIGE